ncbi:MAG: glycine-rich domain-containing protein [Pseudomonadota bacterium]
MTLDRSQNTAVQQETISGRVTLGQTTVQPGEVDTEVQRGYVDLQQVWRDARRYPRDTLPAEANELERIVIQNGNERTLYEYQAGNWIAIKTLDVSTGVVTIVGEGGEQFEPRTDAEIIAALATNGPQARENIGVNAGFVIGALTQGPLAARTNIGLSDDEIRAIAGVEEVDYIVVSGTAPTPTFPGQIWVNTTEIDVYEVNMRSPDNAAWRRLGVIDPLDDNAFYPRHATFQRIFDSTNLSVVPNPLCGEHKFIVIGGGGGGGGAGGFDLSSSGGNSGDQNVSDWRSSDGVTSFSLTVGAGGVGVADAAGTNGGATTASDGFFSITAGGGRGGRRGNQAIQDRNSGSSLAFELLIGQRGTHGIAQVSGRGGDGPYGGGGPEQQTAVASSRLAGASGNRPGAGGGGALHVSNGTGFDTAGGDGANGRIILLERV